MKYQKLDEPVFIQTVELINSKYGGEVYEIKMMGIKSQSQYYTYADPQNVNWAHWEDIVELASRKGVVLVNCKLKDPSKGLINADSSVKIEVATTKEHLKSSLEEHWNNQDQFTKFFGPDNK